MKDTNSRAPSEWLARYAQFVVLATFVLILIGGHTTTSGAGMAFPDWPLSHGSVNPSGWWNDVMQRLEHGHRIVAETVATLIGILCAWVWRSRWSLPLAFTGSIIIAITAHFLGASREVVAHLGLWSAALIFSAVILFSQKTSRHCIAARWLAFAAFLGVLAQAILGGLRVTIESGGDPGAALFFRLAHACFAHFELALLVALAVLLSRRTADLHPSSGAHGIARAGWIAGLAIFLQLIAGAAIRHLGAGLAIGTFPHARATGELLPADANIFVALHFAHSRIGAFLVTAAIVFLMIRVFRSSHRPALRRPAIFLGALVCIQAFVGMLVIWQLRPPFVVTLHVVTGAAILALTVLISVRAQISSISNAAAQLKTRAPLDEAWGDVSPASAGADSKMREVGA